MANNIPQSAKQGNSSIYDFRWLDKSRNSYVLTPLPIASTATGGHQPNQGVAAGNGVPTRELLSDQASAGVSGLEKGFSQAATLHGPPFGTAAKGLDVVGKINDGINIVQHLKAERYREAAIETGGALGQSAGAASGGVM